MWLGQISAMHSTVHSTPLSAQKTEDWKAADRDHALKDQNGQQLSENFTTTKLANSESGYWSVGEITNIYYFNKYFCCNCCHQSPVVIFWQMHWLCKQCTAVFHSSGQLPSRPQVKAIFFFFFFFFFLCEPSSNSSMQCSHFDDVTMDLKLGIWIKFLKET